MEAQGVSKAYAASWGCCGKACPTLHYTPALAASDPCRIFFLLHPLSQLSLARCHGRLRHGLWAVFSTAIGGSDR